MLRHDGYISLCLNIRLVGVTIHYCTAERINRILTCECVLVMADSNKGFTGESSFDNRNSHDPVDPLAAVETSTHQSECTGPPPDGGQGDLPLLKKKPTSFQITSVTVQGSRLSADGGDDSADDLDESHTEDLSSDVLDLSRTTDVDNDPLSEENSNNAAAEAVKSVPVKQAAESQPTKVGTPTAESDIPSLSSNNDNNNMQSVPPVLPTSATLPIDVSNTKSAEPTNESASKAPTIPDQWQHRFKVVKIVSSQPYKRGRWLCMDFMDPPSIQSSEAKLEVPVEAMTNVTVGSGGHAETVMCGTQTTNNVAHVYEIPPNESYPGSISVTVCPQPIQQPFYGIFLPLNNSQMPDMAAMPRGFAQDSTRKFESSVPSMQPITVGFINQPSQFSNVSSSMQQAPSYVGGSNKSYEESSAQSQSYVSQQQPLSQTQSFAPQSQQQQPLVTQAQNFSSVPQQQQQPAQTTQTQSFAPQSQQQQPLVTQAQNFSSVSQQQQQAAQTTQTQSFAPQSQQQQPLVTQAQNFSSVPQQQQQPAQTTQAQSFAPQSQQQQPLVTQSQNFSSVPQQPAQSTQSFVPQSQQQPAQTTQSFAPQSQQQQQQQPLVTQSQNFSSVSQQLTTQTQSSIQQSTPQVMSSEPSVPTQSISQAGSQQPTTTHPVTDTSTMQVTQAVSSVVAPSVQQQALSAEQMPPPTQPAVPPQTAFNSQNLTQASGASEPVPMTVAQAMPTATTIASGTNIPSVNVPPSIPDNVISSNMQPMTSIEVHNVPSQLHYNHVDARENSQSSGTQVAAEEVSAAKTATTDEAESAPSGSNTVAIDNKIEQAMDLVKSHLMFAVREEVDVLKEKITELVERISLLEYENTFLKANASQETLSQLNQSQQLHQQQQQQQQTQNAAVVAQSQPQQNLQSQQPTL